MKIQNARIKIINEQKVKEAIYDIKRENYQNMDIIKYLDLFLSDSMIDKTILSKISDAHLFQEFGSRNVKVTYLHQFHMGRKNDFLEMENGSFLKYHHACANIFRLDPDNPVAEIMWTRFLENFSATDLLVALTFG